MESGHPRLERKPWEASAAVPPRFQSCSPVTAYSGANPILLTLGMHCGFRPALWCGFAEAKKVGISPPKKGSKGRSHCAPSCNTAKSEGKAVN